MDNLGRFLIIFILENTETTNKNTIEFIKFPDIKFQTQLVE